ncbi:MAG: hypothetical protein CME88_15000 [Hirschia sp.]|nr:hypothetical protein [Hirschia sp.]MBF19684.1 hypothetical protein [Hirschia sp.]
MVDKTLTVIEETSIFRFRDVEVMLDVDVASAFGIETKRVNEARGRNAAKFNDEHAFQLSPAEWKTLKSHIATANAGRGGRRTPPWVYTIKGVGRLAMILDTSQALAASDLILDTFLQVYVQLKAGREQIAIVSPSRYQPNEEERDAANKIRKKLSKAVEALLDSVLRLEEDAVLRSGAEFLSGLKEDVIARLKSKPLENDKLAADTQLVLAEARKLNSEADGMDLANLDKKIAIVERLQRMYREMEPHAFIDMMDGLSGTTSKRLK